MTNDFMEYRRSRRGEFYQGLFFALLMAFMFVVTPLLLGQGVVKKDGQLLQVPGLPVYHMRIAGATPGQVLMLDSTGYVIGGVGTAGPAGASGPPATFRGNYASGTTYAIGDAVHYTDGSSYVSLQASNVGKTPGVDTAWWGLQALAGTSGVSNATLGTALAFQASTALSGPRNLFADQTFYGGLVNYGCGLDHSYDGSFSSGGYGHFSFNVTGVTSIISNSIIGASSAHSFSAGAFYDIAGTCLLAIGTNTVAANTAVSVPAGAVTFLMSSRNDTLTIPLNTYMMVSGTTLPANYISPQLADAASLSLTNNNLSLLQSAVLPFAGKTIFIFGDSISYGGNYLPSLVAITGASSSIAMSGGGGQPMAQAFSVATAAHASNPTGPSIAQLVANEIAGASLILIEFGTNDGSTPLGTINDAASTPGTSTTFYGDCKMVWSTLESAIALNAPAVMPTVVAITPYLQSRVTGTALTNLITAEQAVFGGLAGWPVLNWATTSGINSANWSATLLDTVHPNALGGRMAGSAIARFVIANAHQ